MICNTNSQVNTLQDTIYFEVLSENEYYCECSTEMHIQVYIYPFKSTLLRGLLNGIEYIAYIIQHSVRIEC